MTAVDFGDADPEDRIDAGDPAAELVAVLAAWVTDLEVQAAPDPDRTRRRIVLALAFAVTLGQRDLTRPQRDALARLIADLEAIEVP